MAFNLIPWKKRENSGLVPQRTEHPLNRIKDEFDALFDRFFGRLPAPFDADWGWERGWGLDLDDRGKEVVVRAEAPGFEPSEFDVQVSGNVLTIRAEHQEEGREGGEYCRHLRFHRSVTLPAGTQADQVEARYRNGVLEVRLPKSPQAQGKRIEVKT
jgi:HSP20 family protein